MTRRFRLFAVSAGTLLGLLGLLATSSSAAERFILPAALLQGYSRTFKLDVALKIHLAIELEPKDRTLDALAATMLDPASPNHRTFLTEAQFVGRFGRPQADVDALANVLHRDGATAVYVARNRLVVGADVTVRQAENAFRTRYDLWRRGDRTIVAPTTPLTLPVAGIRAVRGAIKAYTPRLALAEAPGLPSDFRAAWFSSARFREAYDALPEGGAGMRIALIEDSSDRADPKDVAPFSRGEAQPYAGGPPVRNAVPAPVATFDPAHVGEELASAPISEQLCGRDDRGQEPTIDADAALALAPMATIDVRYDEVCVRGGEGTVELQRALDEAPAPDVIVFPFAVAPLYGPLRDAFGPPPIPYLEATLRGIPIVVPAGDDGAYGIRVAGIEQAAVTYPCVLPYVICAGGTQLGERNGQLDEGPWNDGTHASGGGLSLEPRPQWQQAPMDFALAHDVRARMVPDVSADASGHLYVFWHGYGEGGVGGTSESAAIVGAQLAAIDAAVPKERRIAGPGDLYALASAHPEAFRDVVGQNDRGYRDNTLRPRPQPLPLGYAGVLPSPPPTVKGCAPVRPDGCDVAPGYDMVTGIGSLKERAASDALRRGR
jgi:hypothetical protein